MQINLAISDMLMLVLYATVLTMIAMWHMRGQNNTVDFLLAGRKLTLPVFVGTLVSTWYGGIFGIAEFTGYSGLGAWLTQGILWYFVYLAFAIFLAKRIRAMPFYTIADILEAKFSPQVAFCGGIFTYLMVNPAPYILSLGIIIQVFTGVSLVKAVLLSALFTVLYTAASGFRGVVYTDVCQCLWMYIAFACLAYFSLNTWGGVQFLDTHLSHVEGYRNHLQLTGGMDVFTICVWAGMACWVFVDPNFYQRCYAAASPVVARRGIIVAVLFWSIFDILCCGTALYAFAARNAGEIIFANDKLAHLALANHLLPSPLKGFFLTGILAAIMSTADSFLFAGAMNISRDYYWRFYKRNASNEQMVAITRWGIILTSILATILAIWFQSVVALWYTIGTIGLSALLIPVLFSFQDKLRCTQAALVSIWSGAAFSTGWFVWGRYCDYPWGIEPLYPGLAAALLFYIIALFLKVERNG